MTDTPPSDATFASDWLALREPVDHRSRAAELAGCLARAVADRSWSTAVDLGCGTGSNLRYLAPRLPGIRKWLVVDHDRAHLDALAAPQDTELVRIRGDLASAGLDAVDDADVVTASALLDLVSATWVDALVERCGRRGAAALFSLSYDGRVDWSHPDPEDPAVRAAVNRHQERDKGLGAALGPDGGTVVARAFEGAGYVVSQVTTPWRLEGPADLPLVRQLVAGWVEAACETDPNSAPRFEAWGVRRLDDFRVGRTRLTVGHVDVLALPPERS